MNEVEKGRAGEISTLHLEIIGHLRQSLEKAIRIGELLIEQKASMKHGEFGGWITESLPFTDRTARNYMRLYRERDKLKTETISDLTSAYKLLKSSEEIPDEAEMEMLQLEALLEYYSTDCDLTVEEKIKGLMEVEARAGELVNFYAERKIKAEREFGRKLNELKNYGLTLEDINAVMKG